VPRLTWRSATEQHRTALSQFVCTDPPKQSYDRHRGRHHPRPYELEVQSHLRGLKVPVAPGDALLLGFDEDGIAAAAHFGFDDTQTQFMIWAVACAHRCRGRRHGREAVEVALQALAATKRHYDLDCGVFTHVDPRNGASRAMVASAGFEYLDVYDGYEGWVRDI
jgi:hypothetical protein